MLKSDDFGDDDDYDDDMFSKGETSKLRNSQNSNLNQVVKETESSRRGGDSIDIVKSSNV